MLVLAVEDAHAWRMLVWDAFVLYSIVSGAVFWCLIRQDAHVLHMGVGLNTDPRTDRTDPVSGGFKSSQTVHTSATLKGTPYSSRCTP